MKRRMGADEAVLHIGAGAPAWLLRDLIERLPPEHHHTAAALAILRARGGVRNHIPYMFAKRNRIPYA